jgi:hypothetical protein
MSHRALQRIIGTAVTDPEFCTDLLNGKRQTVLTAFDLSAGERNMLLTIEASSLQEFASQLEEQLQIIEEQNRN